jgi:hypothetical protein
MARAAGVGLFAILAVLPVIAACSRPKPPPDAVPAPVAAPIVPKVFVPIQPASDGHDGSTVVVAMAHGRTVAYVADEDDSAVRAIDLTAKTEVSRTPLEGRPGQMIIDKQGRLLVALRTEQAVAVLKATDDPLAPLESVARIETAAAEPIAIAITPDDATLVVTTGWGHSLETYDLTTTVRGFAVDLAREPRAVTVTSDGQTAYVAHASAGHLSAVDLGAHAVAKLDLGVPGWTERVRPGRGHSVGDLDGDGFLMTLDFKIDAAALASSGLCRPLGCPIFMRTISFPSRVARQGFALAKMTVKGKETLFMPHAAVATGDAKVRSSGYGGGGLDEDAFVPAEVFDIDVISAGKRQEHRPSLNVGANTCRLPRAAVARGDRLFVSCTGVDKVMEFDAMRTFKRAVVVPGGPTGLAFAPNDELVAWSRFDRTLSKFSTSADKPEVVQIKIAPASTALGAEAALGERLFHKSSERKISRDGRACASCHPDGRDDGLVWSTPDGPRQTIHLAGRVEREAPFGWLGKHGSLKEHMTITMRNLKGTGLDDSELGALASWLRAMRGPPRAKVASLGEKELRGRELFNSSALQCGSCHAEKTGFSDRESHDIASATPADISRQFLVPSLRFVGGTGPYFHDGRYASLGELLEKNDKMGDTKSLVQEDRVALEAYLRTL